MELFGTQVAVVVHLVMELHNHLVAMAVAVKDFTMGMEQIHLELLQQVVAVAEVQIM